MNWNVIVKILLAIVAFVVIAQFIQPLLAPLFPPLGIICLIVLYIGIVWWLLAGPKLIE